MSLRSKVGRVACSRRELVQIQPPNIPPGGTIALILSDDRMSEMKDGSFPPLGPLERPPWFMLSLEAMLVSVVQWPRPC